MENKNNSKPAKNFKASEKLWLSIAIAAVAWSFYIMLTDSFQASKGYFIISSIAVVYYFVKRFFRKRVEKQYEEKSKK